MAQKKILVSDLSGEEVSEENGALIRITYPGAEVSHVGDLTRDEVTKLFTVRGAFVLREQGKRGRKKNGAAEAEAA